MTSFIWQLVQTRFEVNYRKRDDGDGRFTILLGWGPSRMYGKYGEPMSFGVRQPEGNII